MKFNEYMQLGNQLEKENKIHMTYSCYDLDILQITDEEVVVVDLGAYTLLISSYHIPEDIFQIPLLINDMRDDYKFYIRFNGHGCLWPCDYVLFAV